MKIMLIGRRYARILILAAVVFTFRGVAPTEATAATWYVSNRASRGDGRSWATAWNELDRIDWSVIHPGDAIELDGGGEKNVYTSTLNIGANGEPGAPITIRRAAEPGRDGQVIIFGGRSTPLVAGHAAQYVFQTAGVRKSGVDFNASSNIVLDGLRWRGIVIYGHNLHGIHFSSGASHLIVRNVEIYDNGKAMYDPQRKWWNPDQPGVGLTGSDITFERAMIHDNGQDAFQSGGGLAHFTLRDSWLYNGRPHPDRPGLAYNYTMHSDGIQVYGGGVQSGMLIEGSIFGPGLMQGTILGQAGPSGDLARVDDVIIRNCLFIDTTNANIMGYPQVKSRNWTIDHVTAYMTRTNPDGKVRTNVFLEGPGHRVTNSIFYGSAFWLPDGAVTSGNIVYNTQGAKISEPADPQFIQPPTFEDSQPDLQKLIRCDFALRPGSPAQGKGAVVTSVRKLLGDENLIPIPPPVEPRDVSVAE